MNKSNEEYSYITLGRSNKFIKTDSIGCEALEDNTNITSVTVANGISRIEGRAFANCKNLKSLKIPSTITYIDDTACPLTIYGECGSVAEKFAEKYENITFIKNNPAMHSDCPKAAEEPIAVQSPVIVENKDKITAIEKTNTKPSVVEKGVKWTVSNKKAASINKKTGKLTAKKSGKIIVKATCNNVTKTFKLTIKK